MPSETNLTIEAGTTYRRTLRFTQGNPAEPLDLTGSTLAAWMGRGAAKIVFAVSISDAAGGIAQLELDPEQTRTAAPGTYAWDLLLRAPSGDIAKHLKGTVTLNPTVTRPE